MTFRLDDTGRRVTRQDLADPDCRRRHLDRLLAVGAIDLRGNARVTEVAGYYAMIEPIDPTKRLDPPD